MPKRTHDRLLPAWFAIRVRAGSEFSAGEALRAKNLELFVPAYRVRHRWCDRWKWLDRPLFPGYLFCRCTAAQRPAILSTAGVLQVVGNGRRAIPVDDREILAVRELLASELPVSPWPFCRMGGRIRIAAGPLQGIEGILLAAGESRKLIVSVDLLQRSIAVEIDPNWAVPLDLQPQAAAIAGRGLSCLSWERQ